MTILGIVSTSLVAYVHECIRSVERTRDYEAKVRSASAYLDKIALWPREDLDRHLGDRPSGSWRLTIQRVQPTLYDVTVLEPTGAIVLVHTVLFREEKKLSHN